MLFYDVFLWMTIYTNKSRNVQNEYCIVVIAYLMQILLPSDILDTRHHLQIWILQIVFLLHLHAGQSHERYI